MPLDYIQPFEIWLSGPQLQLTQLAYQNLQDWELQDQMRQEECELQKERKLRAIRGPKDLYRPDRSSQPLSLSPGRTKKAALAPPAQGFAA